MQAYEDACKGFTRAPYPKLSKALHDKLAGRAQRGWPGPAMYPNCLREYKRLCKLTAGQPGPHKAPRAAAT